MNDPICRIPPDLVRGDTADVLPLAGEVNWGMDLFGVDYLRSLTDGAGFKVGVVDTGIDESHEILQPNFAGAKDFTGSAYGYRDRNGHGCVAPWDKMYTSLCGLQCAEYLFDHAPGIAHFIDDRGTIIKDVSRYDVKTVSADPVTGQPVAAKIMAVHKLHYRGPVFTVTTGDGTLTLTPWHPVYVVSSSTGSIRRLRKVRADKLKVGDKVLVSGAGPDIGDIVKLPYYQRWKCIHCGYEARGGKRPRCRGCHKSHWHEGLSTKTIQLDEDLAYWLGLVVSDGHVHKNKRQPSIDFTNRDERIGEMFSNLCEKLFGIAPARYQYGNKATTWRLNSADVYRLVVASGIPAGSKSSTIRVPNLITKSPRAVILAFIAGLLEGDGCVRDRIRLATGSREFAEELVTLLQTLGIKASWSEVSSSKSDRPSYNLRIGGDSDLLSKVRVKTTSNVSDPKRRVSSTIKDITVREYNGPMYDLTVEGTHNYVANGHIVSNTHCSGTTAGADPRIGVASKARLYHGKGLGDSGSGSMTALMNAIEWCLSEGCRVVSNSWGGGTSIDPATDRRLREWAERGAWLIFAAGNEGPGTRQTSAPGNSEHVINCAALNKDFNPATFTSAGSKIDTSGPGVNIWSARPGGGYQQMSGTSMATPFLAGMMALLYRGLEVRNLPIPTVYELRKVLFVRSTDTHTPGDDNRTGPGWVNPVLLSSLFTPDPTVNPQP